MRKLMRYAVRILPLGLIAAMSVVVVGGGNGAAEAQVDQRVVRGNQARTAADVVKDQYIVTLAQRALRTDSIGTAVAGLVRTYGGQAMRTYTRAIHGYSVAMNAEAAKRLASDPNVESVSPVQRYKATDTQPNPPWGLDRIDQAGLPLDHSYTYPNTAPDVTAYVIDTGIRYSHQEFGGRATFGFDAFGGDGSDCFGHGTAVASVLGGTTLGVAKGVHLVSVRVVNCAGSGTTDTLIAGLDWIATHLAPGTPAVANISLGATADPPVDAAVTNLVAAGVPVVVAAGNDIEFTCDFSPARVGPAITVGATDFTDTRAWFSNYGNCNDLFAPGVEIVVASHGDDVSSRVDEGTSFSAPHVAGAAALLLQDDPALTPAQVQSKLVADTNKSHRILNIATSNPPTTPVPAGTWHTGNPPGVSAASRVALASEGGRTDAFVASTAAGHPIMHSTLVGTTWTPWENLGGTTVGNPTAVWVSSTRLELWVTGTDRAAWHRVWNGSFWSNWESLAGTVTADLVVVSPEPGVLDLYAISSGDAAVWLRNFDGFFWTAWYSFGGPSSKHNFSVATDPFTGADVIFAQGADGSLYYKYFDAINIPFAWVSLGGVLRWDIKAVFTSDGNIEVAVVGTDKAVWHRRWNRATWSGWESLGGVVSGDGVEAVATDAGIVDVFARSTDSRIWNRRLRGTWSPWALVSLDTSTTIPSAAGGLTYEHEMAFPRVAGGLYAAHWN